MAHEMTHDEVRELLGAYALDATSADESAAIADHLVDCVPCRSEVAEHREVAALLASEPVEAPPGIWQRIALDIAAGDADQANRSEPSLPPIVGRIGDRSGNQPDTHDLRAAASKRATGPRTRWSAVLAAAVLIVVVAIGSVIWRQQHRIDQVNRQLAQIDLPRPLADAAAQAASEPGARPVDLRNGDGQPVARVVVLRDRTAYLIPLPAMAALPPDRTYQLWAIVGHTNLSMGVLGADPAVTAFRIPTGASTLAVTTEQSPGVITSTNAPVASTPLDHA